MTSNIDSARSAILSLHALAQGLKTGSMPDPNSVLAIQADLVKCHTELGEELSKRFGAKEHAYLGRKIAQAKQYQHERYTKKLTASDSTENSLLAVGEEINKEIEAAQLYEQYRLLLRSLQNSVDYARTLVSYLKTSEANS